VRTQGVIKAIYDPQDKTQGKQVKEFTLPPSVTDTKLPIAPFVTVQEVAFTCAVMFFMLQKQHFTVGDALFKAKDLMKLLSFYFGGIGHVSKHFTDKEEEEEIFTRDDAVNECREKKLVHPGLVSPYISLDDYTKSCFGRLGVYRYGIDYLEGDEGENDGEDEEGEKEKEKKEADPYGFD